MTAPSAKPSKMRRASGWPAALVAHEHSESSHLLTFEIQSVVDEPLPILPGQHLFIRDGEVERPYTPISVHSKTIVILVKLSPPPPQQPQQKSSFSQWLVSLSIGERVHMRGPFGAVALQGLDGGASSSCSLHLPSAGASVPVRRLALVAGGSGVAAAAQILNACAAAAEAGTLPPLEIFVLLSDRTEESALLTSELLTLQQRHPSLIAALHRNYTRSHATSRRIDVEMLRKRLPPPSVDTACLISGPPGFESAMSRDLASIGHAHIACLSSGHVRSPAIASEEQVALRLLQEVIAPWLSRLRCFGSGPKPVAAAPTGHSEDEVLLCA